MKTLLDTNIVLYLLGGKLAQPLPQGHYFISVISEMELLSYPTLTEAEQTEIIAFLSDVTVIGLTDEVKSLAVSLRRSHALKLPDAIIAATALCTCEMLLTNDARLLAISGLLARPKELEKR